MCNVMDPAMLANAQFSSLIVQDWYDIYGRVDTAVEQLAANPGVSVSLSLQNLSDEMEELCHRYIRLLMEGVLINYFSSGDVTTLPPTVVVVSGYWGGW